MIFTKENNILKIIFIIFGMLIGLTTYFISLKLALVMCLGLFFALFTFYNINVSLGIFALLSAITPHEIWNNMFIMLGSMLYLFVFTVQYFSNKRKGIDLDYIAPSLVMYVLFCIISLFTGWGGANSIKVVSLLFSCIIFTILITNTFTTLEEYKKLVLFIFLGLFLTAIYGFYQKFTGIEIRADFIDLKTNGGLPGRLFSTMSNANNYAEYLIMFMPFCISYILATKNELKKILLTILFIPCFIALVLTFSRGAYLALIGGAFVYILIVKPRYIPIILVLGILCIPFIPDTIIMRFSTIGKDSSSSYRLMIWEGVARVIKNYWASGIGIGPSAFTLIYRAHAHQSAGNAMHAHNVLINTLVEVGIGGFIAMLAYLLKSFTSAISTFINSNNEEVKYFSAAGATSIVTFVMVGMVEHVWFYPRDMLTFWMCMGLTWAIIKINRGLKQ